MLYPLSFNIQSEDEQHGDIENESLDENQSHNIIDESLEDQPTQQGPLTHSHTKALMKANLLMSEYFDIDKSFCPKETVQSEEVQNISDNWSSFPRQAVNHCMQIFQLE